MLNEIINKLEEADYVTLNRYLKLLKVSVDNKWELLKFHREEGYSFYVQYRKRKEENRLNDKVKLLYLNGLQATRECNQKLQNEIYDKSVIIAYIENKLGVR